MIVTVGRSVHLGARGLASGGNVACDGDGRVLHTDVGVVTLADEFCLCRPARSGLGPNKTVELIVMLMLFVLVASDERKRQDENNEQDCKQRKRFFHCCISFFISS